MALSKRSKGSASKGSVSVNTDTPIRFSHLTQNPAFYMLRLYSDRIYTGSTRTLRTRCIDHWNGDGGETTKRDPPVQLLHFEYYATYDEATARERQVKRWTRAKKEALARADLQILKSLSRSHDHLSD
jgi:putative endonuclease